MYSIHKCIVIPTNFLKFLKTRIHVTVSAFRSFSPTPFPLKKLYTKTPTDNFFFRHNITIKTQKPGNSTNLNIHCGTKISGC